KETEKKEYPKKKSVKQHASWTSEASSGAKKTLIVGVCAFFLDHRGSGPRPQFASKLVVFAVAGHR
ncbi:MAG: hypothetical protein Q8N51_14235, partial [Gammaproteobacteria bacterium]|nr:hypothetical protein [Gammaproteobacteria bacterium]